ncbi:HDOD domain-containing protein [Limisalsivibrio acetivorans]|uniref:HDOD domain-containing protein n=1 Tax=Limisalsivibrio acetivorans TaxID=1304888 RepID=UPI0003B71C3E|nr:HDOD domain-containing protein [Limisalsivibrio acetivorans]
MGVFLTILALAAGAAVIFYLIPQKREESPQTNNATDDKPAEIQREQKLPADVSERIKNTPLRTWPEGHTPMDHNDVSPDVMANIDTLLGSTTISMNVSTKLIELLGDQMSSAESITKVASTDAVLSAKILAIANSSYFNIKNEVTSLHRAILLLGYNNVKNLVVRDLIGEIMPSKEEIGLGERLWVHTMAVNACAKYITENYISERSDDMTTAAMIHDLGRHYLHLLPQRGKWDHDAPVLINEENVYGINHAVLGYLVCQKWKVPESAAKGVLYHHHPLAAPPEKIPYPARQKAALTAVSDTLANLLGFGSEPENTYAVRTEYLQLLRLNTNIYKLVTPQLVPEIRKSVHVINSFIEHK